MDDKCPNEPETYNGFQDDDGCPDQSDVKLWVCPGGILDHIFFRRDAARVEAVSLPIVDVVAKTLLANPDINLVEVIGHASRDERDGLRLSTRRANAVTAELVHRGVQATRLTSRGYGSSEPLDRARTKAANEKNRRVEFVVKRRDGKQIVIIR